MSNYETGGHVRSVCELTDGLVAIAVQNMIEVWNLSNKDGPVRRLSGHTEMITKLCRIQNGNYFFSSGYDKTVSFWSAHKGECIYA